MMMMMMMMMMAMTAMLEIICYCRCMLTHGDAMRCMTPFWMPFRRI
jgi:hypothetical protein